MEGEWKYSSQEYLPAALEMTDSLGTVHEVEELDPDDAQWV